MLLLNTSECWALFLPLLGPKMLKLAFSPQLRQIEESPKSGWIMIVEMLKCDCLIFGSHNQSY